MNDPTIKALVIGAAIYFAANAFQGKQAAAPTAANNVTAVDVDQAKQLDATLIALAAVLPDSDGIRDTADLIEVWDRAESLAFDGVARTEATAAAVDAVWPQVTSMLSIGEEPVTLDKDARERVAALLLRIANN